MQIQKYLALCCRQHGFTFHYISVKEVEKIKVLCRNPCFAWQLQPQVKSTLSLTKKNQAWCFPPKITRVVLRGLKITQMEKIFSSPGSKRCPVETIKSYLSHLKPKIELLFQRPKAKSTRFNPEEGSVWFERKVLGHNTLENMLKNMSQMPGIQPHFTNHSLRATTVTVLSSENVETRQIQAVTGHKFHASIQSYCEGPP